MKIAVIGSGVSGLTAAYLLSRNHDVDVFEKNDCLGGHVNTIGVIDGGKRVPFDTGFMVFNRQTYPNLDRMFSQLGMLYSPADMSFGYCSEKSGVEYSGRGLNGFFSDKNNLVKFGHWQLMYEIYIFNDIAKKHLKDNVDASVTLEHVLQLFNFSNYFYNHYFGPMCASIWMATVEQALKYSATNLFEFLDSHGMLRLIGRHQWYVVKGGANQYVEQIRKKSDANFYLNSKVELVKRDENGVDLILNQQARHYDKVIFACHSDEALNLLDEATMFEQQVLGELKYHQQDFILHTDERILPSNSLSQASWNYLEKRNCRQPIMTYDLNRIHGVQTSKRILLTTHGQDFIRDDKIIQTIPYSHFSPQTNTPSIQQRWQDLDGLNNTHYCGAYWGHGFHEDGVKSALLVASKYGERL